MPEPFTAPFLSFSLTCLTIGCSNMKAQTLLSAFLVVSLPFVGGCQEPTISQTEEGVLLLGTDEVSDVVERVTSLGSRTLILEGFAGSVRLTGTDSDVARLSITRAARGDSPEEANEQLGKLVIDELGDELSYRYEFSSSDRFLSQFHVEGTVPSRTPVQIRWTSGDLTLTDVHGPADIQTSHGDVAYSGGSTKVVLRTRNGTADAVLSSAAPTLEAELLTANGDVSASLPPSGSTHVEAATSAGSISVEGITFASQSYSPADAGARFQGRLGEGSGRVSLTTQHGSVNVRAYGGPTYVPSETAPSQVDADRALGEGDTLGASRDSIEAPPDTIIAADTVITASDVLPPSETPADSLK